MAFLAAGHDVHTLQMLLMTEERNVETSECSLRPERTQRDDKGRKAALRQSNQREEVVRDEAFQRLVVHL